MSNLKVALVEDDKEAADTLLAFLQRLGKEENITFEPTWFSSPVEFIETYKAIYAILFLDIRMPSMTGMDLAREIRKTDNETAIIFVTSLAQYAVESYDVNAANYILKPLSYPEFRLKVNKVLLSLPQAEEKSLLINTKSGSYKINIDDIRYCETEGHFIVYHTLQGDYRKRETMKEAVKALGEVDFLRINSCYLVRLKAIRSIEGREAILDDGTHLAISRPRYSEVMRIFQSKK